MVSARDLPIKSKLTLVIMATTCGALLLACLAFVINDYVTFRKDMIESVSRYAEILGASAARELASHDTKSADEIFGSMSNDKRVSLTCFYTKSLELAYGYRRDREVSASCPRSPESAGHRIEKGELILNQDVFLGGELVGRLFIRAEMSEMNARLARYAEIAGLVLVLSLIAGFALSAQLQKLISAPIFRLAAAAREVTTDRNYSIRVKKLGNDEIGVLTDWFNGMLTRIQSRDQALRNIQKMLERRVEEQTQLLEQETTSRQEVERVLSEREEQLRQSQKMDAIGRLAGGVAHDFNNLLTGILGYSTLIKDKLSAGDPLLGYVEEIRKAGDRAASLTRQLLAFSRKQVLEAKVIDINATIANLEKMLRRLIGENIRLTTRPAEPLGRVKADPGQIEQVILNLVVNARDAMPPVGGEIIVETVDVELTDLYDWEQDVPPGPYVCFSVIDNGCGMDAITRERVFEPFFTTKEQGKGTGLGLSTVYGIVKQSGGHISVFSQPGAGTTFKIYLPRVHAEVERIEMAEGIDSRPHGTETILLVEDEDLVRNLAKNVLLSCGYKVLEAPAGNEAIMLCEYHRGPIHLVLSDMVMPELNGRELVERLRPIRPDMRVLFMTGYTELEDADESMPVGELPLIQKPFTPDSLAQRIRRVLDQDFVA